MHSEAPVETDRRARLLRAGVRAFAVRRYEDVSAKEVAAEAGVAHGLLFHYFGTKRGFFLAVLEHAIAGASDVFAHNDEPDPARWLVRETDLLLTSATGVGVMLASLIQDSIGAETEANAVVVRIRANMAGRVMAKLAPEVESPLLAATVAAWAATAYDVSIQWARGGQPVPRERVQDLLIATLDAALRSAAARDATGRFDPGAFAPRERESSGVDAG